MPNRDSCPHRPPCPGCPRFGVPDLPQGPLQQIRDLTTRAGLPLPQIHQMPGRGHRHRARLAIRGRARSPKIGLFQAGTHRIADTPRCPVHHPLINETAAMLRDAIRESGIEPYADRPHRGALRYAQFLVERATDRVQVVLVGCGSEPRILGDLPAIFADKLGTRLQGLFFNGQPERSNAILGPTTIHLAGASMVRETFGGVDVFYPPVAFVQNHLPLYARAIDRIAALVPDRSIVSEFYAGVGSIGLGLLGRSREVRFNERSPDGLAGLEAGLAQRPAEERDRTRLYPGAAEERLDALAGSDVVLVDPPRRGLDPTLCDALAATPPHRLVYLACGLDRLIQDLERLTATGALSLAGIEIFDFFPFTEHVETLAWLERTG